MFKPTAIYCAWDALLDHTQKSFRKQIAAETYKVNRDKTIGASVYEKSKEIEMLVEHLGIYNMYPFCLEADDVIAFLTRQLPGKKMIVSSDRDLLQLINNDVHMYSLAKKVVVSPDNFEEFTGISRESFLMFKCLVGDASDNIAKVTTPSKAKKIATGIADMSQILSQDQVLQYQHNDKMMNLHESFSYQPNELPRMQQQLQQLNHVPNFDAFMESCKQLKLNSIVDNAASWRKTFFKQQNMTNLIKLLGLNK